jgi:hypothetical protein
MRAFNRLSLETRGRPPVFAFLALLRIIFGSAGIGIGGVLPIANPMLHNRHFRAQH